MTQDAVFRRVNIVSQPVSNISRYDVRTGYRVFRSRKDGFEASIPVQLIERAFEVSQRALPNEWIGRLVGKVCRERGLYHVAVFGLAPDVAATVSPGYAETSAMSASATRRLAACLFPDADEVGWIHGHTGCGARFSATDLENQKTWSYSYAIGIVVDPISRVDIGVYRGPNAELLDEVPEEARHHAVGTERRNNTFSPVPSAPDSFVGGPSGKDKPSINLVGLRGSIRRARATALIAACAVATYWIVSYQFRQAAKLDEVQKGLVDVRARLAERAQSPAAAVAKDVRRESVAACMLDDGELLSP